MSSQSSPRASTRSAIEVSSLLCVIGSRPSRSVVASDSQRSASLVRPLLSAEQWRSDGWARDGGVGLPSDSSFLLSGFGCR